MPGHNFTDAFALLLAAFGFYLQSRPGNQIKTYGYQRAGVLAAFINAVILVVLSAAFCSMKATTVRRIRSRWRKRP